CRQDCRHGELKFALRQDFGDFGGESDGAVGFLDEAGDLAAGEAAEGFGLAVAAEDDYLYVGADEAQGVVGGAAVHAGHTEVEENEVDRAAVLAEDLDGGLAAGGEEGLVSLAFERELGVAEDELFI